MCIFASVFLFSNISTIYAAGGGKSAKDIPFSFEGPFGTFDNAQLQRGFKVYREVCSSCHSLDLIAWRNLGDSGGPFFDPAYPNPNDNPVIKALAGEVVVIDGPDSSGEMFERPGRTSDYMPAPYENVEAARVANGGAYPPDLSLITKSREGFHGFFNHLLSGIGGPEYVYSLLTGYSEAPEELMDEGPSGSYYNPYFSNGLWIAMAPPLLDGQVDYDDGTEASVDQMSKDVSAFLAWAAEPKMEERKRIGFQVMIYLFILAFLLYLVKKKVWSRVDH